MQWIKRPGCFIFRSFPYNGFCNDTPNLGESVSIDTLIEYGDKPFKIILKDAAKYYPAIRPVLLSEPICIVRIRIDR